jgi:uncharacterized protein (DUF1800 family)
MELFTLGRGNYTENDIKEAARAFTGWGSNLQGEFVFRKNQHDYGSKKVLGHSGNFDGGEVLDILLDQEQTARYITNKIYTFLVNDKPDVTIVNTLAKGFFKSGYDIQKLLAEIFTSEWFYEEKNMGVKIKSPVELLVGIQRILPMTLENENSLLVLQRILGQVLFYPPNVAGWPGGRTWIDSSTLMMRMRIPQLINDEDEMNVTPKDDDDQMMGRKDNEEKGVKKSNAGAKALKKQQINANVDWDMFINSLARVQRENLVEAMSKVLLQVKPAVAPDMIRQYADESGRENFIKSATIQIMSTPEYQLC